MSRRINVALFVCFILGISFAVTAQQDSGDGSWQAVDEAINKGLPKDAIENLTQIADRAVVQKSYAEAIKAIAMKVALESNIQGNKPEEKITRMREAIKEAPAEMRPVMEAIVANWFWHYLQQNRWRFMQRTQTSELPSDDFTTWDLPRILQHIDRQFDRALENADELKKVSVEQYDRLLEKGNVPDAYRPTLFDFVANNALEFYVSGEQVTSRAEDAFDLSADSPVFGGVEDFMSWEPTSSDEASLKLRAIELYQDLLSFHREDDERSAFLDTDLARIQFGFNRAFGETKRDRYKAALVRFEDQNQDHATAARATAMLAQLVYEDGDYVAAREIAQRGLTRQPDTVGGRRCFNLIQQIEAKSARIGVERVWNDPRPMIDVHYRNVTQVYFRLVPFDFQKFVNSNRWQPEALNEIQRNALLKREPIREWNATLPATEDFQERVESLPAPDDLPSGSYYLIGSHDPSFAEADNQVSFAEVWESDLALIVRNHPGGSLIDGFVMGADGGNPVSDARVDIWQRDNRGRLSAREPVQTDANGMFRIPGATRQPVLLLASKDGQSLSSASYLRSYSNPPVKPNEQTRFFTDRAMYRPGQTIRYKGICIAVDQTKDNYQAISGRTLSVLLQDVNGETIARSEHRTNDYGSFNGSFTAPRDRLMGRMTLRVADGPRGAAQVTVEEYKRPKFQVELDAPDQSPKLNNLTAVSGKATAYTGAAIDGAKVRWRVVREVRYPAWWYWRNWWMSPQSPSQEIAHGVSDTDALGRFQIEFMAKPDAAIDEDSEPRFRFTVYADVTDRSGETRSDERSITVGYTALAASMSTAEWLTDDEPVELKVRTTTLDDEGAPATGSIRIFRVVQPDRVVRPSLWGTNLRHRGDERPEVDPTNPNSWPVGELIQEFPFETNGAGDATVSVELSTGFYRAKLESVDRFGKSVTAELPLKLIDPDADALTLKIPNLYASPTATAEPGDECLAIWGSGYEAARAFIEVEHRGKLLQSFWTDPDRTQQSIRQSVEEPMRGGFTVRTTMVRENRAYTESHYVNVPWTNKQLEVKWERLVSKLEPGAKETWTAIISGNDAEAHLAEMVATLYDASLDAYQTHTWPEGFGVFRRDYSNVQSFFENQPKNLRSMLNGWQVSRRDGRLTYRHWPQSITQNLRGFEFSRRSRGLAMPMSADSFGVAAPAGKASLGFGDDGAVEQAVEKGVASRSNRDQGDATSSPNLDKVSPRKNLQETAFFFPHLVAANDGTVRMTFTMPEALTEWKFLGFAHDRDLRSGLLSGSTVTAKELMVQPNAPRFLREGDSVEFAVKITNQSPTQQTGTVRLSLYDARTEASVDATLGIVEAEQAFAIPAGESQSVTWRLRVPDGMGYLKYRAVGSSGRLADGEEGFIPVLSRRVLVNESIQLPIRGAGLKEFDFEKLLKSADSDSLQHQALTVQMTSNPSWYAVMALPYLMEYPHQCSEQVFNRLYANVLARHIATSDPKIERVFEQWRGTPALASPLEKNEDLKSVMLQETPWLRDAKSESEARRNVGVLFDQNRLDDETTRGLRKLSQMQLADGAWPWFPGGRANDYITLYITTGFGRLRHLGVDVDVSNAVTSLARLDGWAAKRYQQIKPEHRDKNHLSTTIALYLYGRSFFLNDRPVAAEHREAVDFWVSQAQQYWLDLAYRQSQAHLAVALKRFGRADEASAIMKSIKQRSVTDEELGMYWRDTEVSWWWYRAPIETQAMMIEAFDEVMNDQQAVEECKVWLLKQKQTRDWKTTKGTADAVYALLLRGSDMLASDALVDVTMGEIKIQPEDIEAGTGFYEQRFSASEIKPELGAVRVEKVDDGVAWGGVHWQYLEDISEITPHQDNPLRLTKQLFVRRYTGKGPELQPVAGPLAVGDEVVVRVVLRTDRDMEYLHLKDQRGSGTEPVNVLSQYKYQDGLAYYESTRDTASHFFIDYLPKGTYVFEYATRVQLNGTYQSGIATIECMYAPEFNSHSESFEMVVE